MIEVAAVIATEEVSGPGRQLAALAPALTAHGIRITVIVLQRNPGSVPFVRHLSAHNIPHLVIRDRSPLDLRVATSLRRMARELRSHIIQTHGYKATAAGWCLRQLPGAVPWIGYYHGATTKDPKDTFYQWTEQVMLRAADEVVVVSPQQKHLLERRTKQVSLIDNAIVPPSAVSDPLDRTEHCAARAAASPVLGVIGRLSREKGVDLFIEACAMLLPDFPQLGAIIAGEGPEDTRLRRQVARLQLDQHVHFVGHIPDPNRVYACCDVVVLPSRSEGMPNVLLEAIARDLPVVATNVGAMPDVLDMSDAGILVPRENVPALAAAISKAIRVGLTPLATVARRSIAERYSLARRVASHVSLYQRVAAVAPSQTQLASQPVR